MDKKIKLDEVLIGKKMEPRYMEYNWRDIILYALAVGAHREDVAYTYEKYLKAIPTYGTIPYWGTVNVKPYQWMPLPASMLADEIIKPTISFLNMDHEIIMHRPIDRSRVPSSIRMSLQMFMTEARERVPLLRRR